jgi:hypothetical protein
VEAAGGEVPERLLDEVADDELDAGVLAVLALDERERLAAVGDEGEVLPGRKQLLLGIKGAHAAGDQPLAVERRLGDLRLAGLGVVVQPPPLLLRDRLDRSRDGLGESDADRVEAALRPQPDGDLLVPEARVAAHEDLAGGGGAADASDQLVEEARRAGLGVRRARTEPDVQHLVGAGAGRQQRVVAAPARVPVGGALLLIAVHLADEGVEVDHQPLLAGAGARLPGTAKRLASTRSSWRTCPNVNERRNVPSVEGASTRWPVTRPVRPVRSRSQSSIESAPNSIAWHSVSTFRPGPAAPGRSPRSTVSSTSCSISSLLATVAGSSKPAFATARSSSNSTRNNSTTTPARSFTTRVTS